MEQLADDAPRVPMLDVPVSLMVGQLVEVFRHIDTVVPEQVIDVPKISSHDTILQRAVLLVPQMVEQLSDVPVPSPRDCVITATLTEVVLARRWDTAGRHWWLGAGAQGSYWWRFTQSTSPVELTASPGRYINTGQGPLVAVTMQLEFQQSFVVILQVPQLQFIERVV